MTGILSGPGVSAAKAQFVDPVTVDPTVYLDSFQTNLDVIGHDWKAFILSTFTYEIPDSVVYFVKVANDDIWKLTFLDFEGSSTGTAVFEKEKLGVLTPVLERRAPLSHFGIYPNPTISTINVICESDRLQAMRSKIAVSDLSGKILVVQPIQIVPGLNAFELNIDLASGVYQVSIRTGRSIVSRQLVISQTIHH